MNCRYISLRPCRRNYCSWSIMDSASDTPPWTMDLMETLYRDVVTQHLPLLAPCASAHSHHRLECARGAGRNVTAITNPVVCVSGTTAATQLTFCLKAHTHAHASRHTHIDTAHIKNISFEEEAALQSPIRLYVISKRVHVAGLWTNRNCLSFLFPVLLPHLPSAFWRETRGETLLDNFISRFFFLHVQNKGARNRMHQLYIDRPTR